MADRKGPWKTFPFGKYKGRSVLDIIDEDLQYVMFTVKQFLNLSPRQAEYFYNKTGVDIPEEFIVEDSPEKVILVSESYQGFPSKAEYFRYLSNMDIEPNYNFDNE